MKLNIGDKAPHFEGINQRGEHVSLSDYSGKKVILYFYPKDNTPGCSAEACSLRDKDDYFSSNGFVVIGVSPDSSASHGKFAEKYGLPFDLIADTDKQVLMSYGVWGEKKNYGRTYMGVVRTTFIISETGTIEKIFTKVDTKNHAEQIIESLK